MALEPGHRKPRVRQLPAISLSAPECVESLTWRVYGWVTRRLTTKSDGTVLDDSKCYPTPPTRGKSWPACVVTTTVWHEEPDGPDGGWQALNVLGTPRATGTWLFGLEAENRIREAWIPLGSRLGYIGQGALKKFLTELRLTEVSIIGGQVTVTEIDQLSAELGRRPAVIYGFDSFVGKWTTVRVQRAEIVTMFAIFGTSTSTETTRQLVITRSQKYCFWDVRHGLGQAGIAYESHFFPKRSSPKVPPCTERVERVGAQMSSEALWD